MCSCNIRFAAAPSTALPYLEKQNYSSTSVIEAILQFVRNFKLSHSSLKSLFLGVSLRRTEKWFVVADSIFRCSFHQSGIHSALLSSSVSTSPVEKTQCLAASCLHPFVLMSAHICLSSVGAEKQENWSRSPTISGWLQIIKQHYLDRADTDGGVKRSS